MSTRYFAEGASNGFFSTRIALFNPSSNQVARVTLRLLGASGETTSIIETLQPKQPKSITFTWNSNIPEDTFSTVIESDLPVVADRVMAWGEGGYGEHMERAIEAPATTWYLAEGATHGSFNLFYLLQNANTTEATVTVTYLRLAPATPVVKTYTVEAHSRRTIWVDDEGPELAAAEISAVITANVPIIAERAMYADRPGQPFAAGHEGAGVSELATNWFLAEGATGSFFDMYVLVGNPGTSPAALTVSYLLPSGERFSKPYVVGPQNRLTISVDGEDPRLLNTPVSVIVESTQPVVVERAMWWPSPNWYETHLSAGSTTTGTKWALAANDIGQHYPELDNITYILIANTSNTQGTAAITIYPDASLLNPGPGTVTLSLPPNSRTTYPISFISSRYVQGFAAEIEADVPIVVERAMYKTRDGVTWTTGSAALATKLQ
jgi:hypothetical protein